MGGHNWVHNKYCYLICSPYSNVSVVPLMSFSPLIQDPILSSLFSAFSLEQFLSLRWERELICPEAEVLAALGQEPYLRICSIPLGLFSGLYFDVKSTRRWAWIFKSVTESQNCVSHLLCVILGGHYTFLGWAGRPALSWAMEPWVKSLRRTCDLTFLPISVSRSIKHGQ